MSTYTGKLISIGDDGWLIEHPDGSRWLYTDVQLDDQPMFSNEIPCDEVYSYIATYYQEHWKPEVTEANAV